MQVVAFSSTYAFSRENKIRCLFVHRNVGVIKGQYYCRLFEILGGQVLSCATMGLHETILVFLSLSFVDFPVRSS